MATVDPGEAYKSVLRETGALLKPLGYRRRGANLRLVTNGMAGIVNFQKSQSSTKASIKFTVNVGVVCGALLHPDRDVSKALEPEAHSRQRIGAFFDPRGDKWWTLDAHTDVAALANEVATLIVRHAVPFIDGQMSPAALLELWSSGRPCGLTRGGREMVLARLRQYMAFQGRWTLDATDSTAAELLGAISLEFGAADRMDLVVHRPDGDQVSRRRYRVDGSVLVTSQDSAPDLSRVRHWLDGDTLILECEGVRCRFVREVAPGN